MSRAALFALVLLAACTARAQGVPELITDRPDQTESAVTIVPGWVQLEGGLTYTGQTTLAPALLARLGVIPGAELRLGAQGGTFQVDEVSVGGKVRLWDEHGAQPEAALLAELAAPTDGGVAGGQVRLALANTLSDRLSLGYNIGATWSSLRLAPRVLYTLTLGIGVADAIGAFAEVFGVGFGVDEQPGVAAGFTYLVVPNMQLDVSGGYDLQSADSFVGIGASYRLPR